MNGTKKEESFFAATPGNLTNEQMIEYYTQRARVTILELTNRTLEAENKCLASELVELKRSLVHKE